MEFENLRKKQPSIFSEDSPGRKWSALQTVSEWRSVCLRDSRRSTARQNINFTPLCVPLQLKHARSAAQTGNAVLPQALQVYLWTTAFIISCVTFSKWKQRWKVRSHRRFLRVCTGVRRRWLCSLKLIIQLAGKWICWGICDLCDTCITLIECSFFPPLNMHHKMKSLLILLTMRKLEFTAAKDRTKILARRASLLGKEQQRGFA